METLIANLIGSGAFGAHPNYAVVAGAVEFVAGAVVFLLVKPLARGWPGP